MDTNSEAVVRACFRAYETKDRDALEAVIADDFTFTSPIDDAIERKTYFERCWPNSEHLEKFDIETLLVGRDEVVVRYLATSKDGSQGRNMESFIVRDGKIRSVHVYFGNDSGESTHEEEIRSVIKTWAEGIRSKDVEATARHVTEDAVNYLLAPPLVAGEDLRTNLRDWFATFEGGICCEFWDLRIIAHGDTAYAHALNRLSGTKTTGEKTDLWFRLTLGLRKADGGRQWRIAHSHESVPFLMDGSGKAALDLKP